MPWKLICSISLFFSLRCFIFSSSFDLPCCWLPIDSDLLLTVTAQMHGSAGAWNNLKHDKHGARGFGPCCIERNSLSIPVAKIMKSGDKLTHSRAAHVDIFMTFAWHALNRNNIDILNLVQGHASTEDFLCRVVGWSLQTPTDQHGSAFLDTRLQQPRLTWWIWWTLKHAQTHQMILASRMDLQ